MFADEREELGLLDNDGVDCEAGLKADFVEGAEAVSYTHLDVYKRQIGNIAAGLASEKSDGPTILVRVRHQQGLAKGFAVGRENSVGDLLDPFVD